MGDARGIRLDIKQVQSNIGFLIGPFNLAPGLAATNCKRQQAQRGYKRSH